MPTPTQSLATIRYSETEYNKNRRNSGSIDVALNGDDRNDAKAIARQLKSKQFDEANSSPLVRTIETVQIMTKGRIRIMLSVYAQEWNYGLS
jgi:broad specificity phosphatase PhoE